MIKQTKIGIEIDVKAYLKEVKGYFYVILVYKNAAGKRKDKSFPTKLPVRGNKTKAKNMSEQILIDFEIPDEDLYMAAIASTEAVSYTHLISRILGTMTAFSGLKRTERQ